MTLTDYKRPIRMHVGFMKVVVENRMMITQIKKDLNLQVGELTRRIEKLEEETKGSE